MVEAKNQFRGKPEYSIVYAELITAARYRGIVTYQETAKLLGWPLQGQLLGNRLGKLLGEISEDEVSHGRPMLSAIVVSTSGRPSEGFFNLARDLGKLRAKGKPEENEFLEREQKAVHDAWKVILPKKT